LLFAPARKGRCAAKNIVHCTLFRGAAQISWRQLA
jgi:hypothetical protein